MGQSTTAPRRPWKRYWPARHSCPDCHKARSCLLDLSQDPENGPVGSPDHRGGPRADRARCCGPIWRLVVFRLRGARSPACGPRSRWPASARSREFALWSEHRLQPRTQSQLRSLPVEGLWQDSLRRGLFAPGDGPADGASRGRRGFSAALLQDMAVPILAKEYPQVYQRLLEARQGQVRLSDLERKVFGWTHADAGGLIARQWNLPKSFARTDRGPCGGPRRGGSPGDGGGQGGRGPLRRLPGLARSTLGRMLGVGERLLAIGSAGSPTVLRVPRSDRRANTTEFAPLLTLAAPTRRW